MTIITYTPPASTDSRTINQLCRLIAAELARRNWSVPGIRVQFMNGANHGERVISEIRSDDVIIRYNSCGDPQRIGVPGHTLEIWHDSATVTYRQFLWTDWEAHREDFFADTHAENDGAPVPMFVTYKSACVCEDTRGAIFTGLSSLVSLVQGDPDAFFVPHEHDDGRGNPIMLPKGVQSGMPVLLKDMPRTAAVMAAFSQWLSRLVKHLRAQPLPARQIDVFNQWWRSPLPFDIGPLFMPVQAHLAADVLAGGSGILTEPRYQYWELRAGSLYPTSFAKHCTLIAYPGERLPQYVKYDSLQPYSVRVTLNRPEGVYVGDRAVYELLREGTDYDHEAAEVWHDTIVPLTDYVHSGMPYEKPVVFIARPLEYDEVGDVRGPWIDPDIYHRIATNPIDRVLLQTYVAGDGKVASKALHALARRLVRRKDMRAFARISWWSIGKKQSMEWYISYHLRETRKSVRQLPAATRRALIQK